MQKDTQVTASVIACFDQQDFSGGDVTSVSPACTCVKTRAGACVRAPAASPAGLPNSRFVYVESLAAVEIGALEKLKDSRLKASPEQAQAPPFMDFAAWPC